MPTLFLILCLSLTGSSSCPGPSNKNLTHTSSQSTAAALVPLLAQVESCDEPAMRVFLRLKIATYLWANPGGSIKAESVVTTALADLRTHEKEIPALYVAQFRRNLVAQLKVYAPELAAHMAEEYQLDRRTDLDVAFSLLGRENGTDQAVRMVQKTIAGGTDPGHIIVSFLHRLETLKPEEVPSLLEAVIAAEESHQSSISSGTLFGLKHLVMRQQTPKALQRRYLVTVIGRAGEKNLRLGSVVDMYTILADVLPVVEKQLPDLYYSASAALAQLAERVPKATLERIAIDKRVNQSDDPLTQMLVEKEAVTDPSLKEDLQIEAAKIALGKGQIETAIQLVSKINPKSEVALLWRDQFIEGAAGRAIAQGDLKAARHGVGQIQAATIRSSVLQKIALYFEASNDLDSARASLASAFESVKGLDDGPNKAVALLDLANSYLKTDSQRAAEITRSAVKIINKSQAKQRAGLGSDQQLSNAERMLTIAYKLVPTFQALGEINEAAALDLAKDIQRQELRIAATFGAYSSRQTTVTVPSVASK